MAVFFVTNREHSVEDVTRRNLEQLQLRDPADSTDNLLTKREQEDWGSDKAPRREAIARDYRVLLLVGDDLNDFASVGNKPTAPARKTMAAQFDDMWGVKWFVLPNPNYGGWERALYQFNDRMPRDQKINEKRKNLTRETTSPAVLGKAA